MQTRSQTIKELKEQNKTLKQYIKQIQDEGGTIIKAYGDEIEKEYLIPLRKENKELKEQRQQDYIDYLEMSKVAVNRGQENKKLEEENKKLKEEINHKNNKFSEWIEENRELKEEIEQLKDDCHQKGIDEQTEIEEHEASREQIEELKEEIKKLKAAAALDWAGGSEQTEIDDWELMRQKERAKKSARDKAAAEAHAQELKEEIKKLRGVGSSRCDARARITFWRMCEDLAEALHRSGGGGFGDVISDAGWLEEMKAMIEDRKGYLSGDEGDLFEGYKQWIDRLHGDHEEDSD